MKFESFFTCNIIETFTRVEFCLKYQFYSHFCCTADFHVVKTVLAQLCMQKSSKSKSALSTGQRWKMVRVTNFESTFLTSRHARNVLCTACDVTSFNGQRQLCHLTLVGGRDLSFHTRISAIQSRRPRNRKRKNKPTEHVKLTRKFRCSTTHLLFLPSI